MSTPAPALRPCALASCSRPLIRKSGEKPWHFNRRRYCDKRCAGKARRQPINHGTPSGAQQHRVRGEELCERCKTAEREYQRNYLESNPELADRKRAIRAAKTRAQSMVVSRHWPEYLDLLTQEKEKAGIT